MTNQPNTKRDGTTYEAKFVVQCLLKGLEPHQTTGDYLPHDFLVSNHAGHVFRVQVKGTAHFVKSDPSRKKGSTPRFRISAASGGKKYALDCTKVDCLACVVPGDFWYIIPCLKLRGRALWFYPSVVNSKAYYEQFRDNWDFFLT
jgi:hypothetical protein